MESGKCRSHTCFTKTWVLLRHDRDKRTVGTRGAQTMGNPPRYGEFDDTHVPPNQPGVPALPLQRECRAGRTCVNTATTEGIRGCFASQREQLGFM
jgi:hypothetical protein